MSIPEPMLSTRAVSWPVQGDWRMEPKWDGFRLLAASTTSGAFVRGGAVGRALAIVSAYCWSRSPKHVGGQSLMGSSLRSALATGESSRTSQWLQNLPAKPNKPCDELEPSTPYCRRAQSGAGVISVVGPDHSCAPAFRAERGCRRRVKGAPATTDAGLGWSTYSWPGPC
jgi:hypothetical protein